MLTTECSQAVQTYLKAIYVLHQQHRLVSNRALKARLGVSGAAVTAMIRHLVKLQLVRYVPYQGVALTEAGEQVAREVIEHHRLLERYFHAALAMPWEQAHAEAEQIEHVLSTKLAERLATWLATAQGAQPTGPLPACAVDHWVTQREGPCSPLITDSRPTVDSTLTP